MSSLGCMRGLWGRVGGGWRGRLMRSDNSGGVM